MDAHDMLDELCCLNTGKYLGKIPFATYPELVAKGMSDAGSDNYGGPVVTEGGLVFMYVAFALP